jgi:hypothetical protein
MRLPTVVTFILLLISCRPDSERSRVDKVNDEKFRHYNEKDAHFIINVLEESYGLIDLARVGETRIRSAAEKDKVRKVIQGQSSAIMRLKTFAERRGIAVPFAGPAVRQGKRLEVRRKKGENFHEAWVREMKERQHALKRDIEGYQKKSMDTELRLMLDSTLTMVKNNNRIISSIEVNEVNKE